MKYQTEMGGFKDIYHDVTLQVCQTCDVSCHTL